MAQFLGPSFMVSNLLAIIIWSCNSARKLKKQTRWREAVPKNRQLEGAMKGGHECRTNMSKRNKWVKYLLVIITSLIFFLITTFFSSFTHQKSIGNVTKCVCNGFITFIIIIGYELEPTKLLWIKDKCFDSWVMSVAYYYSPTVMAKDYPKWT